MDLSSFKFSWWAPKDARVLKQSAQWPFKLIHSKVVDFGTNRKRVCDFMLVIISNISCPVSEMLQVFCLVERPHPYPTRILERSLWTRSPMLWLRGAKTLSPRYINVMDRRMDRQTDGRTTYDSNTALALRASRGNKTHLAYCFSVHCRQIHVVNFVAHFVCL